MQIVLVFLENWSSFRPCRSAFWKHFVSVLTFILFLTVISANRIALPHQGSSQGELHQQAIGQNYFVALIVQKTKHSEAAPVFYLGSPLSINATNGSETPASKFLFSPESVPSLTSYLVYTLSTSSYL